MKRRLYFTLIATGLLLVAVGGVLHAQDDDRHRCMAGGIYDESTGNCRLAVTMEFNYPDWIGDSFALLGPVYDLLLAERDEYMRWNDELFTPDAPSGHLIFTYEEFARGEPLRSVVFTVESYTGGINPYIVFRSLTFDMESESLLTWDDLFNSDVDVLAVLQPLVAAELEDQLGDTASANLIAGSTDELSDYQAWALDDEDLVLFFAPYTVAHDTADSFTVRVPLAQLADIVNPVLLP